MYVFMCVCFGAKCDLLLKDEEKCVKVASTVKIISDSIIVM